MRRDYLGPLLRHVSAPLLAGDASGTIERLDAYGLSRDDLMETLPDLELVDKDKPKLFASSTLAPSRNNIRAASFVPLSHATNSGVLPCLSF